MSQVTTSPRRTKSTGTAGRSFIFRHPPTEENQTISRVLVGVQSQHKSIAPSVSHYSIEKRKRIHHHEHHYHRIIIILEIQSENDLQSNSDSLSIYSHWILVRCDRWLVQKRTYGRISPSIITRLGGGRRIGIGICCHRHHSASLRTRRSRSPSLSIKSTYRDLLFLFESDTPHAFLDQPTRDSSPRTNHESIRQHTHTHTTTWTHTCACPSIF